MDENEQEIKSPIRRLGSTRKLLVFNSKYLFSQIKNSNIKTGLTLVFTLIFYWLILVKANFMFYL